MPNKTLQSKLKDWVIKKLFNSGIWGIFFNPFYFARKGLYQNIKYLSNEISGKTLDIGCGERPYENLFNSEFYVGMELIESGHHHNIKKIDVFYDGKLFPFKNTEFDSVFCSQVLEHVLNPDVLLDEIFRVLSPKGNFLITVPFVWDEHEQPFDYGRYSSYGLKHLLEEHGFEIIEHKKTIPDFRAVMQLTNIYFFKVTYAKNIYLLPITLLLTIPVNIIGQLLYKLLPQNEDLFLDNVVLCKKVIRKSLF